MRWLKRRSLSQLGVPGSLGADKLILIVRLARSPSAATLDDSGGPHTDRRHFTPILPFQALLAVATCRCGRASLKTGAPRKR